MSKETKFAAPLYKHTEITEKIIAAYYAVYAALGYGFLERNYVRGLAIELRIRGIESMLEFPIKVFYAGELIGEYFADLVVSKAVIVEVKATKVILDEHEAQLLNYLKASPFEVGLLLNFGPKPQIKRRSFDNPRKEWWLTQNPS